MPPTLDLRAAAALVAIAAVASLAPAGGDAVDRGPSHRHPPGRPRLASPTTTHSGPRCDLPGLRQHARHPDDPQDARGPRAARIVGTQDPAVQPAAACGRCHEAIHREWQGSAHARAWTDPVYQSALGQRREPERCHSCHAPDSVQRRLGMQPRVRDAHRDDGVGCVACHADRGGIAGPFGATTDAHPTVEHPAFSAAGSVDLCASCHDLAIGPVLPVARDFVAAGLAAKGKSCVRCHFPRAERPIANDPDSGHPAGPTRRGRSHALRGPSDPEFCASAFRLAAGRAGERVVLEIGNRAGHRVPGLTYRRFVFDVIQRDAGGAERARDRVVISASNILEVEETRAFGFPHAPGATAARIEVVHELAIPGSPVRRVRVADETFEF